MLERCMRPLKSEGSQTVTSEPAVEWTSTLNFIVRGGRGLEALLRGQRVYVIQI